MSNQVSARMTSSTWRKCGPCLISRRGSFVKMTGAKTHRGRRTHCQAGKVRGATLRGCGAWKGAHMDAQRKRVLSLGAGWQSTTLLLMSIKGELPMLDAWVFADTQYEPEAVYAHLEWLKEQSTKAGI